MNFVLQCLYRLRFWHMLLAIERAIGWRRQLVVLLYHHVRDDNDSILPLSEVEAGVTVSAFEHQIREFCRGYQPIVARTAEETLLQRESLAADSMLVTFDDGYVDNRTLAGPILRKHNVPALIFLPTGYLQSQKRFWWVWLNDIVRQLSADSLSSAANQLTRWPPLAEVLSGADLTDHRGRRDLRVAIAESLVPRSDCEKNEILAALQTVVSDDGETCLPTLDWHAIGEMEDEGFRFGAHTVTHPQLTRLSCEQVAREITTSSKEIANQLGKRPTSFAYPYGDHNKDVREATRQAGFEVSYAANPGTVIPGSTDPLRVPRIQLFADDPAKLMVLVLLLKLSKYAPKAAGKVLTRYFGERFEVPDPRSQVSSSAARYGPLREEPTV